MNPIVTLKRDRIEDGVEENTVTKKNKTENNEMQVEVNELAQTTFTNENRVTNSDKTIILTKNLKDIIEDYIEDDNVIKKNKTENNEMHVEIQVEVDELALSTFTNESRVIISDKTILLSNVEKIVLPQIWQSARNLNWKEVEEQLEHASTEEINAFPHEGQDRGITLLWLAANSQQWDLVRQIIESKANVNFDTSPVEGPIRGIKLLWIAALWQQWDLVRQ